VDIHAGRCSLQNTAGGGTRQLPPYTDSRWLEPSVTDVAYLVDEFVGLRKIPVRPFAAIPFRVPLTSLHMTRSTDDLEIHRNTEAL